MLLYLGLWREKKNLISWDNVNPKVWRFHHLDTKRLELADTLQVYIILLYDVFSIRPDS